MMSGDLDLLPPLAGGDPPGVAGGTLAMSKATLGRDPRLTRSAPSLNSRLVKENRLTTTKVDASNIPPEVRRISVGARLRGAAKPYPS